jgi:hypothetical protein
MRVEVVGVTMKIVSKIRSGRGRYRHAMYHARIRFPSGDERKLAIHEEDFHHLRAAGVPVAR